ncbi:MAG TPA: CGNR zinc finger domain-containing protein [Actinomycetota bacterium]|jgi:predicted RNA-binding Zn ribbon-like protein
MSLDIAVHDTSPAAPGDLELLQRFLNLHVHDSDGRSQDPPAEVIHGFLVERGLIRREERLTQADRERYLRLRDAFRSLIVADAGATISGADAQAIDDAGRTAGLHPHFHASGTPTLEPKARGVAAAFGTMVAIAFVSAFDGTFAHLKLCADETCRSAFYDRSKNHSGRWCSMAVCGNRAKVRAWRERQRPGA